MIIMCKLFWMKNLFKYIWVVIAVVLLSTSMGWGGGKINWNDLIERDKLYYQKSHESPFTGEVFGTNNGQLLNGIKEGRWLKFYSNGNLWTKEFFKQGKRNGAYEWYWGNGQLYFKGRNENDIAEGTAEYYYPNGQLCVLGDFKDGYPIGDWSYYHKDGTKGTSDTVNLLCRIN